MKAKKIIVTLIIVLPLIGLGAYATLPVTETHVYLHQNWFERTGYTDENAEIELPFEVMMCEYEATDDSTLKVQLLVQPLGNTDATKIEIYNIEPLQTESYNKYNFYIEEYSYSEELGKLQIFLKLQEEVLHLQNEFHKHLFDLLLQEDFPVLS